MGWLGWSPDHAWHTPMPIIAAALKGRQQAMQLQAKLIALEVGRMFFPAPETAPPRENAVKNEGFLADQFRDLLLRQKAQEKLKQAKGESA